MNGFLPLLAVILLTRFAFFLKTRPIGPVAWTVKTLIECAVVFLFFHFGPGLVAVALALALLNLLSAIFLGRLTRPDLFQLLTLLAAAAVAWLAGASFVLRSPWDNASLITPLLVLTGFLVTTHESNFLIRIVLDHLELKPSMPGESPRTVSPEAEYDRGRVIGLLERGLIFFLILHHEFNAIGFILAAKGIVRFKETENRSFAEYILIGTLLSTFLAIILSWTVSELLAPQ